MPDKRNENKLLAMLERRGYLRKTGSAEEPGPAEPESAPSRPEADLRYLFSTQDSDAPKVTPAARQPVPGIPNPIASSERTPGIERDEPRMKERVLPVNSQLFERDKPVPPKPIEREQPRSAKVVDPAPDSSGFDFDDEGDSVMINEYAAMPVEPRSYEKPPQYSPPPAEAPSYDRPPPPPQFSRPAEMPSFDRPPPPPPQMVDNYTERYLDIDELYEALALRAKRTDSVYLIEEYLKTLPDSLPDESRRDIVSRIIAASGFDYDLLMGDGVLRVKMLKDYAERFAQYTDDYVSARRSELEELEQQMTRVRRLIEIRRELHKKQFFAIETEAQRLKEILAFITG